MQSLRKIICTLAYILVFISQTFSWGFYSHRVIARHAVYCLPNEMFGFYKKHIEFITEHSTDPDKLSRVDPKEAPRHYIDLDYFDDEIPIYWKDAVKKYTEDTLYRWGVLPWHISKMFFRLVEAFKDEDPYQIILISSRASHYLADATVPLHTTKYYNGRRPEQRGIHSFWETRIPELFAGEFNLIVGSATYIDNIQVKAWEIIRKTHSQVDSVYAIYDSLIASFRPDQIYSFVTRGTITKQNFSVEFAKAFEEASKKQVERNMRLAIHLVASFWYTAWVNAGQPDLSKLLDRDFQKKIKKEKKALERMWRTGKITTRPNFENE